MTKIDTGIRIARETADRTVLDVTLSYAIGLGSDSLAEGVLYLLIKKKTNAVAVVAFNSCGGGDGLVVGGGKSRGGGRSNLVLRTVVD